MNSTTGGPTTASGAARQSERSRRTLGVDIGDANNKRRRIVRTILERRDREKARMHSTICADSQEFGMGIDTGMVRRHLATAGRGRPVWNPHCRRESLRKAVGGIPSKQDVKTYHWGNKGYLYICGQYEEMGSMLQQQQEDKAYALVVAPEWPTLPRWETLVAISQTMWVFPEVETGYQLYQDADGHQLPQRNWRTVPTLVDLHGQSQTESTPIRRIISKILEWQEGPRSSDEAQKGGHTSHKIRKLTDYEEVEESIVPQAKVCRENLEAEFKNTLLSDNVAMKKDKAKIPVRGGDYVGWTQILLKNDYQVKVQKGFPMEAAREACLQELIDDLLQKGMIQPTGEGPWNNNAFPVPKKTPRKWQMVGDYQYVNTQTEEDAHPTPLIEHLIEKRGKYKMWTIIDLK